jgi:hypothetical protein
MDPYKHMEVKHEILQIVNAKLKKYSEVVESLPELATKREFKNISEKVEFLDRQARDGDERITAYRRELDRVSHFDLF